MEMVTGPDGSPRRFRWRGRWYTVLAVLFSWLEAAAWWRSSAGDVQAWRVEARRETGTSEGVYDVVRRGGSWDVRKVVD